MIKGKYRKVIIEVQIKLKHNILYSDFFFFYHEPHDTYSSGTINNFYEISFQTFFVRSIFNFYLLKLCRLSTFQTAYLVI